MLEKISSIAQTYPGLGNPTTSIIGKEAVDRLKDLPEKEKPYYLKIRDNCEKALEKMPRGKQGVVIGAGQNSESWRNKGWKTLDINSEENPDIVADANHMGAVIPSHSLDYIYAECIRMGEKDGGVGHARLLEQANVVLKNGGKLIIQTAHKENNPNATLPDREKYIKLMKMHGFTGVAELHAYHVIDEEKGEKEQRVVYYAEKVREGFRDET